MANSVLKKTIFLTAAVFFSVCTVLPAQDDENSQIFTIIDNVHDYDLDPHTASYSSEAQILINVYEGLFSYNPSTLEPREALVADYHLSRDKKRWTFMLREGIKFSNGDPITADAIKESWLNLLATPNAPYASLFDMVKGAQEYRTGNVPRSAVGIKAMDDVTLVLLLNTPASYLPRLLCHHAFAAVSSKGKNIASGAYIIAKRENGNLTLLKNPQYWDAQNVKIPEIHILQSDDIEKNTYLFNTGKADWVTGNLDINKVLLNDAIQIHAEFGTQYLFFKCSESPWTNSEFRNALLAAVPWDTLRAGMPVPATTLVYPINGYPAVTGLYYTDKYEAEDLMSEARQKEGLSKDKKIVLTFAISDIEYMKKEAQILKDAWAPLGIDLQIKTIPADQYLSTISDENADLFSYTWIGDFADPLAFLELFRTGSTLNPGKWSNPQFDEFLKEAAFENSDTEHMKLLAKAEQLLLDDGVVLPISHPVSLNVIDLNRVGGWDANSFDIHPFKYLHLTERQSEVPNIVMR
ncbi:MAG: peptide ABC transporter substrate-binding protein [Treponema sp.]|jgi:oligopeptide transport system substrate-binding protein|nr:peptide ABC transporter substrate-binding protein [Treponema sp.]